MTVDMDHLKGWIGRSETAEDVISPAPVRAMRATLDQNAAALPEDGTPLPPCWHWLYFLPTYRTDEAGYDGHAALGGFLPPVPLPRRMWAGGRLTFPQPLRVGQRVRKTSTITDLRFKEGRSGPLVFVVVRHEISGPDGLAVTEEHDIVYRDAASTRAGEPQPAPERADWSLRVAPGPLLLFRYSALTFNGHRIHYDRDFCREEGYPGLVVHGPLTATLMVNLAADQCPDRRVSAFTFRALSPVFDQGPYSVHGRRDGDTVMLWAECEGGLAMTGEAALD